MDHAAQPLQRRQCLQRPPDAASSSAHTASSKPGRPTAAEQQEALSVIERMKETGEPPIVARRGQPPKPNVVACAIALYCGESFDSFDDAMRQFGVPRGTDVRGLWVEGKLLQFVEAGGMLPRPPKTTGTAKAAPATFAVAPKAAAQMVPSMAGASVAPTKADGTVTRETAADGTLQMGPARMGPPLMGLPLIEPPPMAGAGAVAADANAEQIVAHATAARVATPFGPSLPSAAHVRRAADRREHDQMVALLGRATVDGVTTSATSRGAVGSGVRPAVAAPSGAAGWEWVGGSWVRPGFNAPQPHPDDGAPITYRDHGAPTVPWPSWSLSRRWNPSGSLSMPSRRLEVAQAPSFCTLCKTVRPGEHGLSRAVTLPDGTPRLAYQRQCRACCNYELEL